MENNKKRKIKEAKTSMFLAMGNGRFSKLPMNAKREFL